MWAVSMAALLAVMPLGAQKPDAAETLLQTAIKKEVVDGNLIGAIEGYKKAVAAAKDNRALAAQALMHMADCYQKLGDAEALKIWAQLVREYADQREAVATARARLATGNAATSTLVWQGETVDIMASSVSADGRYVSLTDWTTGNLLVRDLAAQKDQIVVTANNQRPGLFDNFAEASTISRDGTRVAYSWYDLNLDRYELWVASLRGNAAPHRVYGESTVSWIEPTDWSPDGKWVAANVESKGGRTSTGRLVLVSVADGSARVLKTGRFLGSSTRIFFSPDGKYLAYDVVQDTTGARDVWVTALDGSTDSKVVAFRGNDVVMGWSPDGKHLLFASDRMGSMTLFSTQIVNGTLQGQPELLKPDMGLTQSLGVTARGALFYTTQGGKRAGSIRVAEFDVRSGGLASPREVSTSPQEDNVSPSWSPDGKYLAHISLRGRAGATLAIVLRTANTLELVREITPKMRPLRLAGWQPDSRSLLVTGEDLDGRAGAYRVDVETGDASFLCATPYSDDFHAPVWSADGRVLYYWNRVNAGDEQVFVAHDIASGVEKEIVRRPFLGALLLSPDGRFMATETVDPARNERVLLLVPLDGATPREIMRIPAGVSAQDLKRQTRGARVSPASWMPDSQSFIARLQQQSEGESELWRVPVDGTAPRKLSSVLEAHVFKFTLSPDGRRVAYRSKEPDTPVAAQVWEFANFARSSSPAKR
jgi:Tol biopolymer transport system component